jgi:hypothetical protein
VSHVTATTEKGGSAAGSPPRHRVLNSPEVRRPDRRLLRTFAFDPMSTRLAGRYLVLDVPFESELRPGPEGEQLQVVDYDFTRGFWYQPVDLNDPFILAQDGLRPKEGDPRTHQQVVYAVTMSVLERFQRFVGRRFRWPPNRRLRLVPHAFEGRNAFFDPDRRAVLFGYYPADAIDPGANLPGQMIFTCLSSDIIAHEVTHAIVHHERRYFSESTNPDVFAWHEAFADLIALFQHFLYRDVIAEAVASTFADLRRTSGLMQLAQEFGASTGRGGALRSAIGTEPDPATFRNATEPHARGACFVAAVFDAFLICHQRAIADLLRIATGGSGVLPQGQLPPDLVSRVTDEALRCADMLLGMMVRGLDYLPVVDLTFGDALRAVVTADCQLYPADQMRARATLVECMRKRGIYPAAVATLTDDELRWSRPELAIQIGPDVPIHDFIRDATLNLDPSGAPGEYRGEDDDVFRATAAWAKQAALELGLLPSPDSPISVAGMHVAYRLAEDRQPRPELVIQLAQRRKDLEDQNLTEDDRPKLRAGTTLIAGVDGAVQYLIAKPLPLTEAVLATLPAGHVAHTYHRAGVLRLQALHDWFDQLETEDALSAWTSRPAALRMTFAAIHAGMVSERQPT